MMSLPRVSWMRPTMPVVPGVVPTYTARLTVEVNAPSSGIVAPSAPSILRYAPFSGSTAAVMPMKPLRATTPPMVSCALMVART